MQKVSDAEVEKPCFRTESLIFGGITATFASPSTNARVHTWRLHTDHRRTHEPISGHVLVGGGQLLESSRTFFKCQDLCTSPFYPLDPSWAWTTYFLFLCDVCCSFSCVGLFVTPKECSMPGILSFTISLSLLKFMSIESVVSSNCLILCRPFLLRDDSQFMEEFHIRYLIRHFPCFPGEISPEK